MRVYLPIGGSLFKGNAFKCDYDTAYGTWTTSGHTIPVASTYRIAWRAMAATTGFRTLYPAIIPPGATHVHGIHSSGPIDSKKKVFAGAVASSLLIDFFIRSTGIANLYGPVFENLPLPSDKYLYDKAIRNYLRLNCLTSEYAPLWEEITGEKWTLSVPLRNALERQLAQIEIDVLVAQSLGVTVEELCMIYRTQFPVMSRYDSENHFDQNGRLVPKSILKLQVDLNDGDHLDEFDRTWIHPQSGMTYIFETPFTVLDREKELRTAYAKFANLDVYTD